MDPETCLEDCADAVASWRWTDAKESLQAYREWRAGGGFEPDGGDARADALHARIEGSVPSWLNGYRMRDGSLYAYSSIGSYPIFYLTRDNDCLCAKCAHEEEEDLSSAGVHWEGESIACERCDHEIESAYGVPDATESGE